LSQVQFFDLVSRVEEILRSSDIGSAFPEIHNLLQDPALRKYFFDKNEDPEWIKPLQTNGFFHVPPKLDRDEASGTIGFPFWPESSYLARMASKNSSAVLEVILQIPDTDNPRVHEDYSAAALNMPPELAARLLGKAKIWVQSPYQFNLPNNLGLLIAHLAKGNQTDAALELARVLLEILPDPKTREATDTEDNYILSPEPKARFGVWEYEQIIKKHFPELLKSAGISAFDLLCDLLETAVSFSQRHSENKGSEDFSYIWRRAIEDHPQNLNYSLKEILVSAIRDGAEFMAQSNLSNVSRVVTALEARPWWIFHRIAIYLLGKFPDTASDLVVAHLINRNLFDNVDLRHEYAVLIKENFGRLSQEQQLEILGWIENGPDLEESRSQRTGTGPTHEEIEQYRKIWQRDRLAWFKDNLPQNWKKCYEELVAELGEPEHPEFASYVTSYTGPTSPKSAEELQNMMVTDIVQFLKTWIAPDEHFAPTPEGLGRMLSSVVSQNPERFANEASEFQGLDPTYVRALLSGLREALKQSRTFAWLPVLELCRWVVEQPREVQGRDSKSTIDKDPHWGWARKAVAELLSGGFNEGSQIIPFDHRSIVWAILLPLTDDPDPTPKYEADYGGSNMDPSTLSINTTRGGALEVVIRYALWVSRNLEELPDAKELINRGFNEMPEVRNVLDLHLDVSREPSLAIRSVYGRWLPWLILLDPGWARKRVSLIFPQEDDQKSFWDAAWYTYIIFCSPYDNVFEILSEQYALAVERLGLSREGKLLADPDQQLAAHLMTFYWRGKLDLEDAQGLLSRFWAKSNPTLRGHALNDIGLSLWKTKETISPEILGRLKTLWDRRLAVAKSFNSPDNYRDEMKAFGLWFVSEKFDKEWSINQLIEALKIAEKIEPSHMVVEIAEILVNLVQVMPKKVIECIDLIVRGDKEGWRILGWRDEAKVILAEALKTTAASDAENLIHFLGSRGYLEFGDLLKKTGTK